MSFKLGPAICSRDTGQWIPCFDRCSLTITWTSGIKICSRQTKRVCLYCFALAYMEGWTTVVRSGGEQNQIFSHRWITIIFYQWCSAREPSAREAPLKIGNQNNRKNRTSKDNINKRRIERIVCKTHILLLF